MELFRFILNITHPNRGKGWQDTIAYFTGKVEKAVVGKAGRYKYVDYNEYQIKYYVDGKDRLVHFLSCSGSSPRRNTGERIKNQIQC